MPESAGSAARELQFASFRFHAHEIEKIATEAFALRLGTTEEKRTFLRLTRVLFVAMRDLSTIAGEGPPFVCEIPNYVWCDSLQRCVPKGTFCPRRGDWDDCITAVEKDLQALEG